MKIETKFDVGQQVLLLHDNEVVTGKIIKVNITYVSDLCVMYGIKISESYLEVSREEHKIFSSQEDLIKHLLQNNTK